MGIRLEGLAELQAALERAEERLPGVRDRFLKQEAELLLGSARMKTPVDTGALRSGWHRTQPEGGRISAYNNTEV